MTERVSSQAIERGEQHRREGDRSCGRSACFWVCSAERLGAVDDRAGDVLLEVEALVGQRLEALEVELGAGAGLGRAAGGVELEPELRAGRVVNPLWRNCLAHSSGAIALNSFITDSISV